MYALILFSRLSAITCHTNIWVTEGGHYPGEQLGCLPVPCPIAEADFFSVGLLQDSFRSPPDLESFTLRIQLILLFYIIHIIGHFCYGHNFFCWFLLLSIPVSSLILAPAFLLSTFYWIFKAFTILAFSARLNPNSVLYSNLVKFLQLGKFWIYYGDTGRCLFVSSSRNFPPPFSLPLSDI